MSKRIILLSDFDGTVIDIDSGEYVLDRFAKGDWRYVEQQFRLGELSFEQSLRGEFGMITGSVDEILKKVDPAASIRPYFADVVKFCQYSGIELKLVSGGLDFCIKHILERDGLNVEVICPKSTFTHEGLKLEFPSLSNPTSFSFKDDMVRNYQRKNYRVLYVGDGYADYYALKEANMRFVMKGSVSAELIRLNKIEAIEVADFEPVLNALAQGGTLEGM